MTPLEYLDACDGWMGEGVELARRVLTYADLLETGEIPAVTPSEILDDLRAIVRRELNPCD